VAASRALDRGTRQPRRRLLGPAPPVSGSAAGEDDAISGFTIRNRRIVEMDILADPERLSQLDLPILD
jgi:hypothetical protein